ncbi:chorismate mutase [Malassezia yamatoensis]|uniref:chorismate mutase n=1 Tax=Malassezia yamatoensis TaxID=253288 RepID=A0AAJ5YQW3_9BASI|nr:chorismate mutase [Malassezia yamatoensis]
MVLADSINFHNASAEDILSLERIRATLQRMEESIVFRLIERAQFAHNPRMYQEGEFPELQEKENWTGTWLGWNLKEVETSHAKLGRWLAPDEYPFTPQENMPSPILKPVDYPELLHVHHVNVSKTVLQFYTEDIVPRITARKDRTTDSMDPALFATLRHLVQSIDASISVRDVSDLGMFVSESKFRDDPAAFVPHIQSGNREALAKLITKPAVEEMLLKRIAQKAEIYGQNLDGHKAKHDDSRKIQSQEVIRLYQQFIIPLTKEVEIDYLLERFV